MTSCVGFGLLLAVIVGGIYLYLRIERLGRDIAEQRKHLTGNADEEEA